MGVVVARDIRDAIYREQNNQAFKQAFADFSRACQVAQEAFTKIKNESQDACGYDAQFAFDPAIQNPLVGLDNPTKKELLQDMVEDYRRHLVSNLVAKLKTQTFCSDSQEPAYLNYLNSKLKKDGDHVILTNKCQRFLTKVANGSLKSNSVKADDLKAKIEALTRPINSKMTVAFESMKPDKSKVSLQSLQGERWNIQPPYDLKLSKVQSPQEFLNFLLNFAEQENALVPHLAALSQHRNYKNLRALPPFFTIVAEALQYLQEPIEKTRRYQEKLGKLENQAAPEKKTPITIALINAFRKAANLAPLDQPQAIPVVAKGPSVNLQSRLAMVRHLAAKPAAIQAPPAATAAELKVVVPPSLQQVKQANAKPPAVADALLKCAVPPPPTPQVNQTNAKPPAVADALLKCAVPPPPTPQVKQANAKPPAVADALLKCAVPPPPQFKQEIAKPLTGADAAAPVGVKAAQPQVKREDVNKRITPKAKESRLVALIKMPFVGIKNILRKLLRLFSFKKASVKTKATT